jgi:subtilisin-like proprotein convertase family protein
MFPYTRKINLPSCHILSTFRPYLAVSINNSSDVRHVELQIEICVPDSRCLFVNLKSPTWHGIAMSHLSATACGWP